MDINQVCNLCNKPNDQMLMLACVHDPCINCAATSYAEQIHIKGQSNQSYVCQVCGQQTLLDATTIHQLTQLANSFVKSPSKSYKQRESKGPVHQSSQNAKKSDINSNIPTSNKKVIYYCKDHGEQEISYYCFDCWQNICPECAIHGKHKDHQVKMVKKAISQVKNQYSDKITKLSEFQNVVLKAKDGFLRIIKQTNDKHIRQKHQISRQFQSIRNILNLKQKQMIKELDQINKQNLQTLTRLLQNVNKNYQQSNKIKRNIEGTLKKDQVLILQDFKRIAEVQQQIVNLAKATQNIKGKINSLNSQFLTQQTKQIGENVSSVKIKFKDEQIGLASYMTDDKQTFYQDKL